MARTKKRNPVPLNHNKNDKLAVIAEAQKGTSCFDIRHAASVELLGDKDVALAAVATNWDNFQHISADLKEDRDVITAAVTSDGRALMYCSEEIQADRDIVLAAVQSHGSALKWSSRELADDIMVVRRAVENCGAALEYASEQLQNDKEIVLTALRVGSKFRILGYVSEALKGDREVIMAAIHHCGGMSMSYVVSDELLGDQDLVAAAVQNQGLALMYVTPELKSDRGIVMKAVQNDGSALAYASSELRGDREIAMTAVKTSDPPLRHGHVLQFCSSELRNDRDFVLEAVRVAGFSLQYASSVLQGDREVVETALHHPGSIRSSAILKHASQELKGDHQLVCTAIETDSKALHFASEAIQLDPNIVALAWETINAAHDYDLWVDFNESNLRHNYIKQVVALHTDMASRKNKLHHFDLEDPHTTAMFAEGWLAESIHKKWLAGKILQNRGIPEALGGSLVGFIGIEEDMQVAAKLCRFGQVLCHTKKGMDFYFGEERWHDFVKDAKEATMR